MSSTPPIQHLAPTHMTASIRQLALCILLAAAVPAAADILSAEMVPGGGVSLSEVGTLDWAMWGNGSLKTPPTPEATEFKAGGKGIIRTIQSDSKKWSNTTFTHMDTSWSDGTALARGTHRNGETSTTGMLINMTPGQTARFEFAGAPAGGEYLASVMARRDGMWEITVRQGKQSRTVAHNENGGNTVQVRYNGGEPLRIEFKNLPDTRPKVPGEKRKAPAIRGFAATLSAGGRWWIRDKGFVFFYTPPAQADLLRMVQEKPAPDFVKVSRNFADCVMRFGRDRYGKVHSPLFSVILTRGKDPATTPYPLFADFTMDQIVKSKAKEQDKERLALSAGQKILREEPNPFNRFDFNRILNYPEGLGSEGPHKTTLYGCDIYEDRDLYYLLADLSRVTGDGKYKQAADEAITWWFRNTQQPSGLYPWGEHAGWDLVNDCPCYFDGPSKFFYEANCHEIRDIMPFMDHLAALKADKPSELTPLEKYALGIWEQHFWDKEKGWYNRHGDLLGQTPQTNILGAFPAHLGFYLRVWAAAYLNTDKAEVRAKLAEAFNRTADMMVSRTEKYGFYPFDLLPDVQGIDPGKEAPGQSIRLAHHAVDVARQIEKADPQVAAKLRRFAKLHLKDQPEEVTMARLAAFKEGGGDISSGIQYLQGGDAAAVKPEPVLRDLSASVMSEPYANEILSNLRLYRRHGDKACLKIAETQARLAHERFCDEASPLPRAFAHGIPIRTAQGEPFPDFYFQGAKLMRAFALLGEALKQAN